MSQASVREPDARPRPRVSGAVWRLASITAVGWALYQLATSYFGELPLLQHRPIHMAFGFVLIFLLHPSRGGGRWSRVLGTSAGVAGLALSAGLGAYVAWLHVDLVWRMGDYYDHEVVLGALAVLLVLEATRRATGWALPVIAIAFLLYAFYGSYAPEVIAHRGFSLRRVFTQLYLTQEGIYGLPLGISATLVFNFVLLGAFLKQTGSGQFFIDVALSLFGRVRGGPAKVAVVGSSFFGSISGSAVANVVGTGSFTIPLMKSIGYRPMFAGAVEAAASSGGQIMPPIMGAAAFLMAELLEISYFSVVVAALIPAVLYYVALFCAVDFEAGRLNLRGLSRAETPALTTILRTRWYYVIPPVTLVYLMGVQGYSPNLSAFWTLWTAVAVGMIRRETRLTVRTFLETLREGTLAALPIVAACAASGVILGIINLTGIGLRLSSIMVQLAGGEVILLLVMTMIACLVLGMGLPVTASYMIPALMIGPAFKELGILPIAGHLFILYFGVISNITPPFALAAYAGAGIAGSDPVKTGFLAFRLGVPAFILPYMFVYSPALIMEGPWYSVAMAVVTAIVGVAFLTGALSGYLLVACHRYERLLLLAGALVLIKPGWISDLFGLAVAAIVLRSQRARLKDAAPVAAARERVGISG